MRSLTTVATLALCAAGCVGVIGDKNEGEHGSGPPGTHAAGAMGADDTRRLSPAEYQTTLRQLFGDAPVDAVSTSLAALPDDRGKNEFSTMELGITAGHVDAYYAVAKALADVVSLDATLRERVHPCLAEAAPDMACVESAIDDFAARAFRRPLEAAERDDILASYQAGATQLSFEDGLALALMTILESPQFLYHVELGDGGEAVPTYELADHELASRLSFLLTAGPPDETLMAAVADGALGDEARYEAEIDRLLASDAARLQVRRFFTEWLSIDRIPVPQQSATFLDGVDAAAAALEMRSELEALVDWQVFDQTESFAGLMRSDAAFAGANLAMIYGTAEMAGVGPIADGRRAGLLTRAAFLSTMGETTHPIQRAAFVIRRLLCDDIEVPPPTAGLELQPPAYDANKTARERWTAQTSGSPCSSCHERINPFGFALEKYDALGRYRDLEPILDPDTGAVANELPIDDTVDVLIDGATVTVTGGVGLSDVIASSASARQCLTRKWFRFSHGRRETHDEIQLLVGDDDPERAIYDVLAAVARQPGFRLRNVEASDEASDVGGEQ
jgi:hypothetical protein